MENYNKVKKAMIWFVRLLLYSNLFIAIGAMAFLSEGYLLLEKEMRFDALFILSGSSTFFIYLLIRLVAVRRISKYEPDERWKFFLKNLNLIKIATLLSLVLSVVLFFILSRKLQIALLFPGAVSVLYGIPFGKKFRLRDIGVIKIFLISFVWAFIASVLPGIASGYSVGSPEVILLFFANFCFVFAITLPFDLKDMQIDAMNNVVTIPVVIGEKNTYSLSMLLLFISAALHTLLQRNYIHGILDYSYPILISIFITALLVLATKTRRKNNWLYFGLLDGTLLLQFVSCFIYSQLTAV